MKPTRTTCPYCGVGCGLLATPDGTIKADPEHPANFGRLCSKGAALGETLGLEGRLLVPRINGVERSWDAALDLVADGFSKAVAAHGPDSVAFYVSGQILTEDYYVANKLMKGFIGAANIDTNSRLCMASSVAGHKRAFGSDTVPGNYEDFEQADVVVLVGSNLAWCHPVLFQRLMAAKAARPEMKLVVIDPRQTATAKEGDLHLAIAPDGDGALFNGLLAEIAAKGAVDEAYVNAHVNGFEAALTAARAQDVANTGLKADEIAAFYDLWINAEKVVTVYSQGVNQSVCGTDKVNAIINCHLATGRIGKPGAGPFSVTGQPNAMGGREVGGLANMLACHLDIEDADHRSLVQDHWQSPTICTKPGLKAVELFKACARGDIKALWIIGTNPAVSLPDADFVRAAIKTVPFCVVSDVVETDTTMLADVILPATTWGEKTGTVTNSERRISLQKAFLPSPGKARPDWQIICEVACRMGFEAGFNYASVADIFREYAALSGKAAALGKDFDISALAQISDADYADFPPRQWPLAHGRQGGRFFAKGGFYHPDRKAKMLPGQTAPAVLDGIRFNTGRLRDQWHTMTRTGKSARLSQHHSEPFAEIHPADAEELGLNTGGLVQVVPVQPGRQGRVILRVLVTDTVRRGTAFAPMHWSAVNTQGGRINAALRTECDPFSGQPALKGAMVHLRPFVPLWHGFAASRHEMQPGHGHSAVARTDTGWQQALAGQEEVQDWEAKARQVLNLASGDASLLADRGKNTIRVAIYDGDILQGLFFAAPAPLTISRSFCVAKIGTDLPALQALAGAAMQGRPDPGHIVCACFNVGVNTIEAAIRAGANTPPALGRNTGAGTNCGACKPELQALINTHLQTAAE